MNLLLVREENVMEKIRCREAERKKKGGRGVVESVGLLL